MRQGGGNAKNISPFYVAKELAVSQPVYPHGGQRPQMVYGPPGGQRPQMAYGPPLRPKKPLWQRWWFIALAVFLALVVVGSAAGGGNKRAAARASATPGSGGGAATQENQDPAQQAAPAPTIDSAGSGGAPPARAIRHRPPRTTEFKKAMSPSTPVSPSPRRGSLSPPPRWRREMMCLVLLPVLASPFRIILEKNSTSISWSSSCCPRRALSSMPDLPAPITLSSRARSLTAVVRAVMSASIPISPAAVSSWSSTSRSSPRARSVRRGSTISETSDGPGILPQRSRDARDRLD